MINKKRICIYILASFASIAWLFVADGIQYVDYLVVTASMFSFVINNIFLYMQYKDINMYHLIYNYIVIRIGKKTYTELIVKKIIFNTFEVIIFSYILPILFFYKTIYNIIFYIIYLALLYILFLLYDILILYSFQIKHNVIKQCFRVIPFVLNIVIQINMFQFLYDFLGGIL